eukprot:gene48911-65582_t
MAGRLSSAKRIPCPFPRRTGGVAAVKSVWGGLRVTLCSECSGYADSLSTSQVGGSAVPNAAPSPEQVRDALDEVLGWQGIARSPQLAELLRYVVEKTLAGEAAGIKAYSIAVDVFGRPLGFDPQVDPIVRVQARRLRTLLEQYYQSDQSH